MSAYKLIASDLDGTLLDPQGNISTENLNAIHALTGNGIHFVPCTGRTLCELPPAVLTSPDIRYVIYSNGTVTLDRHTGERLLFTVPDDLAAKAYDIILRYDVHIALRAGELYADVQDNTPEGYSHYNMYYTHVDVLQKFSTGITDFRKKLCGVKNVEVISLFFQCMEELRLCSDALRRLGGLHVAEPLPFNLEIFREDAGKGTALLALAKHLDIDIRDTIGVGDSGNDIALLQTADLGLAVANATDSLKAVCDEVICANTEDAIVYIANKYF